MIKKEFLKLSDMELLNSVCSGIVLVEKAFEIFVESRSFSDSYIEPFLLFENKKKQFKSVKLDEFSEECVKTTVKTIRPKPDLFVLAGETEMEDPKTGSIIHFFIIKLYIAGLEEGYIYSSPFSIDSKDNSINLSGLRFAGTDDNVYLPFSIPEGESSSCNTIKMDPKPEFQNRAAFLIGHFEEERLWRDVTVHIADMYCKLGIDKDRKFELVFEISKFGTMTHSVKTAFNEFNEFFMDSYAPKFENIKGKLLLENTKL